MKVAFKSKKETEMINLLGANRCNWVPSEDQSRHLSANLQVQKVQRVGGKRNRRGDLIAL